MSSYTTKIKGYTLIELLVAVALSFFVVTLASVSFVRYQNQISNLLNSDTKTKIFAQYIQPWEQKIKKSPEAVLLSNSDIWIKTASSGLEKWNRYTLQQWLQNQFPEYTVTKFHIEVFGPSYSNDYFKNSKFKVPALPDQNGNGLVSMDELDQNFSGDLTSKELYWVGLLKIEIIIESPKESLKYQLNIHPRNRWGLTEMGLERGI